MHVVKKKLFITLVMRRKTLYSTEKQIYKYKKNLYWKTYKQPDVDVKYDNRAGGKKTVYLWTTVSSKYSERLRLPTNIIEDHPTSTGSGCQNPAIISKCQWRERCFIRNTRWGSSRPWIISVQLFIQTNASNYLPWGWSNRMLKSFFPVILIVSKLQYFIEYNLLYVNVSYATLSLDGEKLIPAVGAECCFNQETWENRKIKK